MRVNYEKKVKTSGTWQITYTVVKLTPYARVGALLEGIIEVLRPVAAAVRVQLALHKWRK